MLARWERVGGGRENVAPGSTLHGPPALEPDPDPEPDTLELLDQACGDRVVTCRLESVNCNPSRYGNGGETGTARNAITTWGAATLLDEERQPSSTSGHGR